MATGSFNQLHEGQINFRDFGNIEPQVFTVRERLNNLNIGFFYS